MADVIDMGKERRKRGPHQQVFIPGAVEGMAGTCGMPGAPLVDGYVWLMAPPGAYDGWALSIEQAEQYVELVQASIAEARKNLGGVP